MFHEQIVIPVDSSGKQGTRAQFHRSDQTKPMFIWNVGVVSRLWNLRKKWSVYLHMCVFFKKAKRMLYNVCIFLSSKYVLKKLEKQYGFQRKNKTLSMELSQTLSFFSSSGAIFLFFFLHLPSLLPQTFKPVPLPSSCWEGYTDNNRTCPSGN